MSDPAPQYDERAAMRQYDRCSCGRVKGRAARQCKRCWDLERRVRDRNRQWKRGLIIPLLLLLAPVVHAQQAGIILPDSPAPQTLDQRLHERYPDLLKLDSVEPTWGKAARTPGMLIAGALLLGAMLADVASTQHCIDRHVCREGNPLYGQGRAQQDAVSIAFTATAFALGTHEKQKGHGVAAFTALYAGAAAHFMAFAHNRSL